ncbi:MAG: hypothetical protein ABW212_16700 [Pseudonocardia sediminis]
MRDETVADAVRARRRCEAGLLRAGGRELLCDALVEATWYADLFHPWDGCGAEPCARAAARLSILERRLERAGRSSVAAE